MAEKDSEKKEETIIENKEAKTSMPIVKKKEGSMFSIVIIMAISLMISFYWDKIPYLKDAIHTVLDPSAGALLRFNLILGMAIIVFTITLITTIIQKYTTDQKALKELRKEQKILNEEMKKYKDHPEKLMELQKKSFEFLPKTFKLTRRSMLFTGIPFILFMGWFRDTFTLLGDPKFFGFLSWFWFYFILMILFSSILRKVMDVV